MTTLLGIINQTIDTACLSSSIEHNANGKAAVIATIVDYMGKPVDILKELKSRVGSQEVALIINEICQCINPQGEMHFLPAGQHAEMHDKATKITLFVRQNNALNDIWSQFLNMMHNTNAFNPSIDTTKQPVLLDFSPERLYLSDHQITPAALPYDAAVVPADIADAAWEKIREGIIACERDSFGLAAREVYRVQKARPGASLNIIAQDKKNGEVIGSLYALNYYEKGGWTISMLSRRAHAAARKVGDALIPALIKALPHEDIRLGVRSTTAPAAMALYKKHGFKAVSTTPHNEYACPPDTETTMVRKAPALDKLVADLTLAK